MHSDYKCFCTSSVIGIIIAAASKKMLEKNLLYTILFESPEKSNTRDFEMASFAETLAPDERKKYIRYAYVSSWFGCFADVMLDSTALVMIYFVLLHSSNSMIMFATAMSGLMNIPLLIPASALVNRFGIKKMVLVTCLMSCSGYIIMALAPLGGSAAPYIVLAGICIFCASRPIWSTSWYPVLSDILLPEERGGFFGKMRFSYNIITGTVFYLIGQFMGKNPPLYYLQAAMAMTGLLALGRTYCINKIKLSDNTNKKLELRKSFSISVHNAPLVGFSVYSCFLSLSYQAIIPLALLYLKKHLDFDADTVQKLSVLGIAGSVTGFLLYGWVQKKLRMKKMQILVHLLWIIIPTGFFCCSKTIPMLLPLVGTLLFLSYLAHAWFTCCFSQECLSLSRPGNAAMASSFASTYNNIGTAVGRTSSSLLLGHGLLASSWNWNGFIFSDFQSIFLLCAAGAVFCLVLLFSLPSVVPTHDNYYNP